MIKQRIYQIKLLLKFLFTGKRTTDDFDWELYPEHYQGELKNMARSHTLILKPGDYEFKNGLLLMKNKILPLHPNPRLLYETILQLRPNSVMEIGCGGGNHLRNINILSPKVELYGLDLSEKQLAFLKTSHPNLNAEIEQFDITLPNKLDFPNVDIVFTQAVIMHIKTGNSHLVALANLFRIATQQVILMENWRHHEFMKEIMFLFKKQMLPWERIYFYCRESEELKKPHLMIISSHSLPQYSVLSNYKILRDNV